MIKKEDVLRLWFLLLRYLVLVCMRMCVCVSVSVCVSTVNSQYFELGYKLLETLMPHSGVSEQARKRTTLIL